MVEPSTKGSNGRDEHGRFLPGHPGGPGNPHAKQTGKLRSAMLRAVTEKDMRDVVMKLVDLAKSGNVPAAKEVLDRYLGRPVEADLIERLDQVEELLKETLYL